MYQKQLLVFTTFLAGIFACKKVVVDDFIGFKKPSYFPETAYNFSNNEITKAKFELGRKLFYDPILSANNTISCGSCHLQSGAFTQPAHSVSHGIDNKLGVRNSPPIMNLAWANTYMWDGGIFDLDLQPIAPITNHVEMGDSMPNVINKLNAHSQYPTLFKNAFGSSTVTGVNFLKALSQFMLMCVSSNSKYDSVQQHLTTFSADEYAGYQTFQQKCSTCHKEPLFTDYSFRNNGLQPSTINDLGRYPVTNNVVDKYKFKVPSLRNLSYTTPYMHDGRFLNIDAVLDYYTSGVKATENLDPLFKQGSTLGIALTAQEKKDLKTFLKTLDDKSFLLDKKLSEQ